MTVADNMGFALKLRKMPKKRKRTAQIQRMRQRRKTQRMES